MAKRLTNIRSLLEFNPPPELKILINNNYAMAIWLKYDFENRNGADISDEEHLEVKKMLAILQDIVSLYEGLDEEVIQRSSLPLKKTYNLAKNNLTAYAFYGLVRRDKDGSLHRRNEGSEVSEETELGENEKFEASVAFAAFTSQIGLQARSSGKLDEAVSLFEKVTEIAPHHYPTWHMLGATLQEIGKYNESIAAYQMAIKMKDEYKNVSPYKEIDDPPLNFIYNNMGNTYSSIGDQAAFKKKKAEAIEAYDIAIDQYREAIRIDNNHGRAYNGMGNAHVKIGGCYMLFDDNEKAEKYFRLGIEYLNKGIEKSQGQDFVSSARDQIDTVDGIIKRFLSSEDSSRDEQKRNLESQHKDESSGAGGTIGCVLAIIFIIVVLAFLCR